MPADTLRGMVRKLESGFPYVALLHFEKESGLSLGAIADFVRMPPRTLMRRKASGRLLPGESERLLRLSILFQKATALFEGETDAARLWLTTARQELHGETPLDFARTEIGAREVEDLIGRFEHGIVAPRSSNSE
jgi:putative toxin-antitoxin system antitoxin component (TIGR02293 family)